MSRTLTGRDIAAERTRHSISQATLAEAAGLTRPQLSNIETGAIRANQDQLQELLDAIIKIAVQTRR